MELSFSAADNLLYDLYQTVSSFLAENFDRRWNVCLLKDFSIMGCLILIDTEPLAPQD